MKNRKLVLIIQARLGSTRFPRKIMNLVGDKSILEWVVAAGKRITHVDEILIASPDNENISEIEEIAEKCACTVFKGSEKNVLDRFYSAAISSEADVILRITSDCPFFDPAIGSRLVNLFNETGSDYACNNEPFSFPHGYDCEIFSIDALRMAKNNAFQLYDLEHVTPWIKRSRGVERSYFYDDDFTRRNWRLTIDYPEDLELFVAVEKNLGLGVQSYSKLKQFFEERPEYLEINSMHRQR